MIIQSIDGELYRLAIAADIKKDTTDVATPTGQGVGDLVYENAYMSVYVRGSTSTIVIGTGDDKNSWAVTMKSERVLSD